MANPVKIEAAVTEVVKHTESVVSYRFLPQGRVPKFHAGQFLHLALDAYDPASQWPDSRVFSIASAPSMRRKELSITISVKGFFTQRIFESLEVGSTCWLKLPYGEFLFPADKSLVLIAGGVGITPYLSLLKQMLEAKSTQDVVLFYGIRSAEHYLFADLLKQCEMELPNFKKVVYCEDGQIGDQTGILDAESIHSEVEVDTLFFLSGPPEMISSFSDTLSLLGVSKERIVVDSWE